MLLVTVMCRALMLGLLAVAGAAIPEARAETPADRAVRVSFRVDSDGRDNPMTNELAYPELHVGYARRFGPALWWQVGAGLGAVIGAETSGSTAQLGAGGAARTAGAVFVGAQLEVAWSSSRYGYADSRCITHGVLGRATVELGRRVGSRGAVVVSGGLRARKIAAHDCDDGGPRDVNLGPAIGISYEWRR